MSHPSPAAVLLQPPRPTTAFTASASTSPQHTLSPPTPTPTPPLQFSPLRLFTKHASVPGTVLVRVERTKFVCHREVLQLASSFFEVALGGGWSETEPRPTKAGTQQQEGGEGQGQSDGSNLGVKGTSEGAPREGRSDGSVRKLVESGWDQSDEDQEANSARPLSVAYSDPAPSMTASYLSSVLHEDDDAAGWDDDDDEDGVAVVARLWLREEKAPSFQDLLCHIYPRQECLISWNNVGELSV